jgi:predicted Rdx family selenoprotein
MKMKTQLTKTYGTQQQALLRGTFIAMSTMSENESEINNLNMNLKVTGKQK